MRASKDGGQGRRRRGSNRVNRGGSWRNDDASNFRGANRNRNDPANRNDNQGFRLASTVESCSQDMDCPIRRYPSPVCAGTKPSAPRRLVVPLARDGTKVVGAPLLPPGPAGLRRWWPPGQGKA